MYRQEFKELIKVALPLVLAQLAQNTVAFVDTLMVGRLGNEALAGIAIGSTVFHFVMVILSGFVLGVSPLVSQATGAGDEETCGRAVRQGLWLSIALFLPAFVLYWNAYSILIFLNQSPETALASAAYLRAISWGLLPALWTMALRGLLEGKSNTTPIMLISFAGVLLNIFANDVLMFGKFGFPALGLVGTGYASSFVYVNVFVFTALYVSWKYGYLNVFSKIRTPDFSMLKELVIVGGPIGITFAFEISMFSAAAITMGTLGDHQLAAHQIALQMASISFMIPLGLAIATSARVGQAIGAGSPHRAEVAGHVGMMCCMFVMSISALVFLLLPNFIIGFFIDVAAPENKEVVQFATSFLSIAAIFQIVDGLQVAASGSLRGLKDTTATMILTLFSYWCVGCVVGWVLCFELGYGGSGLWWGMTVGLFMAAILLAVRFHFRIQRAKRENEIGTSDDIESENESAGQGSAS
ncbi:MAG: MATE family efflux transporter [Mariniblastus sp.]